MGIKSKSSLLWSLELPNSELKSYLLGTMHVDTMYTHALLPKVYPYIESSKSFYTEVDFSSYDTIDLNITNNKNGNLFFTTNSNKIQKLRNSILKSFQFDIDMVQNLKPIFIINMIAEQLLNKISSSSMDNILYNYAVSLEKKVGGIETISDQISVLAEFDDHKSFKQLIDIGRNPSKFRRKLINLNRHYTEQNIHQLYQLSKNGLGKLKEPLLYERNKKMSSSILEKAHLDCSFFAFGAAHFSGKFGILNYLKHHGAILKPINI